MRRSVEARRGQLAFDTLLVEAEDSNLALKFERETGHLPDSMAEALPFFSDLIGRHHAAMLAADEAATMALREEADLLALRLNRGDPGILADEDAPGCVLTRETAAPAGTIPLWGQQGEFEIVAGVMRVRVEIDGMFGIGSGLGFWPGFSAHAVDWKKPFLSETGYRSFLGLHADASSGLTPDLFAHRIIEAFVAQDCKGRLVAIQPHYGAGRSR